MHRLAIAATFLFITAFPAAAMVDPAVFKQCLIDNSSVNEEDIFRQMLLSALQDEPEKAKENFNKFGLAILSLATEKCGAALTDLSDPSLQRAVQEYGQFMGEKIMTNALSKMGL
jgi:hypothetical protein